MWGGSSSANVCIFVGSERSEVAAYDASTGALLCATNLGSRVRSTPSVVDGAVFVGTDAGLVAALEAAPGAVRWVTAAAPPETTPVVRSSPAVAGGMV